jgi:hypothetical protein
MSKEPKKVIWKEDYDWSKYPVCPCCEEPAYYPDQCCFCGQPFEQDDEILKEFNHSIQIERDGYTVVQASNNHVHIYASDGTLLAHATCIKRMTEKELEHYLENHRRLMKELFKEV